MIETEFKIIETEFKATMVTNFTQVMQDYWFDENDIDYSNSDDDWLEFSKRVSGKEVTIIKYEYNESNTVGGTTIEPDYFEKVDENYLIPKHAFTTK